ncbi:MAG: hypothetical protein QGI08_12185 [Paracoccaceae bacterium]|jgi:hypothetical protein|nr:hypothetical protein [Paracoccaceae bacterium]MDP7186475.1 hypothetical protein [Paracoccaceae bacterium]
MTNYLKNTVLIGAAALAVSLAAPVQAHETTVNGTTTQAHMNFTPQMIMDFAGADIAAMIAEMEAQGYEVTDMSRTFLGRIKVTMQNDEHMRNMFFSRTTGELKQDITMPMNMGTGQGGMNGMMGSNAGSGSQSGMSGNASGGMGGSGNASNMGGSVSIGGSVSMGGSSNGGGMMGNGN